MPNEFEKRSAGWEAEQTENILTGYAIVFNSRTVLTCDPETGYEYGEVIDNGALDGADMTDVVLRVDHQGQVLARTRNNSLKLTVDSHGLKITADLSQTDEGRKMYESVKAGLYDKMSFMFSVASGGEYWDEKTRTRHVTAIDRLMDVAVVTFPAYDQTEVHARSIDAAVAEDRAAILNAEKRSMLDGVKCAMYEDIGYPYRKGENWPTRADYEKRMKECEDPKNKSLPYFLRPQKPSVREFGEVIAGELSQLIEADYRDMVSVRNAAAKKHKLIKEYYDAIAEERRICHELAEGTLVGTPIYEYGRSKTTETNEKSDSNMNETRTQFLNKFIESRAAGDTSSLTAMIPTEISEQYVIENAPESVYAAASVTHIPHAGTVRIPICGLKTVNVHAENAAVTDDSIIPDHVDVTHDEYKEQVAYSDLSWTTSAAAMENMVVNVLEGSMTKQMDKVCVDAIGALTFTEGENMKTLTDAPTFAELIAFCGLLGDDYLDGAKVIMSPSTYFGWILPMLDTAGNPIFDPSKPVSQIAVAGFGIVLDSNIEKNTVYFGNPDRVHLNFARDPELTSWVDNDHNQQKFSIRAVAGATAEDGSFVKLSK